jgi:alkaline phosphatase D
MKRIFLLFSAILLTLLTTTMVLTTSNFVANAVESSANAANKNNNNSLEYGIASGDVTDKTAIIWSKAEKSETMHVQFSNESNYSHSQLKTTVVNATKDFTGHVKLDMLSPSTTYYYKVWFTGIGNDKDSNATSSPTAGVFRTAPSPADSKSFSFVVGGDLGGQQYCRRTGDINYPIFKAMASLSPDFFIFNGDQIYADNDCPASGPQNVTGWHNIPGNFPKVNAPSVNWTNYTQVHDVYLKHWQYNRADPNFQSFLRNTSSILKPMTTRLQTTGLHHHITLIRLCREQVFPT